MGKADEKLTRFWWRHASSYRATKNGQGWRRFKHSLDLRTQVVMHPHQHIQQRRQEGRGAHAAVHAERRTTPYGVAAIARRPSRIVALLRVREVAEARP